MRPSTPLSLTASASLGIDAGYKRSPSLRHMGQTRIETRTHSRSASSPDRPLPRSVSVKVCIYTELMRQAEITLFAVSDGKLPSHRRRP